MKLKIKPDTIKNGKIMKSSQYKNNLEKNNRNKKLRDFVSQTLAP
jgi:hypothetical protein